ncbi:MAG: hypothetical protein JNM18_18085 [Planctomycetaceae bacterium]|nr:hypothetical protein [Planctomycetaceae bacterium]
MASFADTGIDAEDLKAFAEVRKLTNKITRLIDTVATTNGLRSGREHTAAGVALQHLEAATNALQTRIQATPHAGGSF